MIAIGTFVLLLLGTFLLWRGRPVAAGMILGIALASTAAGATAITSVQTVSTSVGTTGQSVIGSFIK